MVDMLDDAAALMRVLGFTMDKEGYERMETYRDCNVATEKLLISMK